MGALSNVEPRSLRKPPAAEKVPLDRYGRDPGSPVEVLRRQTDYAADTGYSPLYHSMLADMPRLLGDSAVAWALVITILRLSLGAPRDAKAGRREYTLPISVEELAVLCGRSHPRDIQRQLAELAERGVLSKKTVKTAGVKYSLSLNLSKWQSLEDYAVWKRRQVVSIIIDDPAELDEDEDAIEITPGAVVLTKRPQAVRPGRASRAVKVGCGVKELAFQNDNKSLDLAFSAVVQSGRLVVSTTCAKGDGEAKGEQKGNAERHTRRALPSNGGSDQKRSPSGIPPTHHRSAEVISLFDPLLQKSGARLLSPDSAALACACKELGEMDRDYLVWFVLNPKGRAARPISSPAAVVGIVKEARKNWEALKHRTAPAASAPLPPAAERARAILDDPSDWSAADVEWAKGILNENHN